MNERIKLLAEQAGMVRGGYANTPEKTMTWRESFDNPGSLEKFAELIVRECAWIANDLAPSVYDHDSYPSVYDHDSYKLGRKFAGIDVLKHFGVEE